MKVCFLTALGIAITIAFVHPSIGAEPSDPFAFEAVGYEYNIAPELLQAISKVESNHRNDATNKNKNNTVDICHMQINSYHKQALGQRWHYLTDPSYCTQVGAWILNQCIVRYGYNWNAVACYNTGYSPNDAPNESKRRLGLAYIERVKNALKIEGNE